MKLTRFGTVCLDGTKIHANAARHHTHSHGHIVRQANQLRKEVQELLSLAEKADNPPVVENGNLPEEMERREKRLEALSEAKARIAERAQKRLAQEKAEYDEKMAEANPKRPRNPNWKSKTLTR